MLWQFIINKFTYFKQKKAHFLFPFFTGALGGWLGMFLTPTIGAIFIAITIYLALVIFMPWNKIPWKRLKTYNNYFIPAIITLVFVCPMWNKLIAIFPTTDPYQQLLQTGKANIEVTVEPNDVISGGLQSFAGLGSILLIKDDNIILEMNGAAAKKQIENGQVIFWVRPELYLKDKSINKPIYQLTEAQAAIIRFEKLPPKSKVLKGDVVFTFNSSVHITIPIPPQTMENDAIIIQDIQKYFKKRN